MHRRKMYGQSLLVAIDPTDFTCIKNRSSLPEWGSNFELQTKIQFPSEINSSIRGRVRNPHLLCKTPKRSSRIQLYLETILKARRRPRSCPRFLLFNFFLSVSLMGEPSWMIECIPDKIEPYQLSRYTTSNC